MIKHKTAILLVYTGGTIGMMEDPKSGQLKPVDFKHLTKQIPELKKFDIVIDFQSFDSPIDSSNMSPPAWVMLANIIHSNYEKYDGFVVLHGSDTMAYSASALSFMLENLNKPIVFTGSQLPMGITRTDGKENLITAIEIAAAKKSGKAAVPEVCIYFEYQLYRGNRTHKFSADHFKAFQSTNYPILAEAGVQLKYNTPAIAKTANKNLIVHTTFDNNVAILKLFPGITKNTVDAFINAKGLRALVLETFGSGNAPIDEWFIQSLKKAIDNGIIILNVTQCAAGSVEQGKYETSALLRKIGVIGGADITTEAAITKLMFLLGQGLSKEKIKKQLTLSLRGEITL